MTEKFKVGDIVEAFGVRGAVGVVYESSDFPVECSFNGHIFWFNREGMASSWHKTPSLVLIEHPKKKVLKTVEFYVNFNKDGFYTTYTYEVAARHYRGDAVVVAQKFTHTYEVEE